MIKRKFTAMLIPLVLLLMLYPAFQWLPYGILLHNLAFSLVVLATLYAMAHSRLALAGALVLGVIALAGTWTGRLTQADWAVWIGMVAAMVLFSYTAWVLLRDVLRQNQVTTDTLAGGVVVYLLIGVIWAFAYILVSLVYPGALQNNGVDTLDRLVGFDDFHTYLYFSYITLTTLGYGDIVPATPLARSLVYLEAVLGQLYLAVLVARLVGQHISGTVRS